MVWHSVITLFVVRFQIASLHHLPHVWTTLATAMNTMLMPVLTSNPGPWTTADNSVASVVCIAINLYLIILVFSVRLLSALRGHFIPPQRPMTADFDGFSIPDFIHYIYCPILFLEKEPVFPFSMLSAKQVNY